MQVDQDRSSGLDDACLPSTATQSMLIAVSGVVHFVHIIVPIINSQIPFPLICVWFRGVDAIILLEGQEAVAFLSSLYSVRRPDRIFGLQESN